MWFRHNCDLFWCRDTCFLLLSFQSLRSTVNLRFPRHYLAPSRVLTEPVIPSVTIQAQPDSVIPSSAACNNTGLPNLARQFNSITRTPEGQTTLAFFIRLNSSTGLDSLKVHRNIKNRVMWHCTWFVFHVQYSVHILTHLLLAFHKPMLVSLQSPFPATACSCHKPILVSHESLFT